MDEEPESISYLSAADIRDIHELIVESNADTTAGISSPGDIEYTVEHIQEAISARFPSHSTRRHSSCCALSRRIIHLSMATSEQRSCRPEFSTR